MYGTCSTRPAFHLFFSSRWPTRAKVCTWERLVCPVYTHFQIDGSNCECTCNTRPAFHLFFSSRWPTRAKVCTWERLVCPVYTHFQIAGSNCECTCSTRPAFHLFFSSRWPTRGHIGRSNRNSHPVITFSAGGAKGCSDHRFHASLAYTVKLLTLLQHRANNQYRMANQI